MPCGTKWEPAYRRGRGADFELRPCSACCGLFDRVERHEADSHVKGVLPGSGSLSDSLSHERFSWLEPLARWQNPGIAREEYRAGGPVPKHGKRVAAFLYTHIHSRPGRNG